MVVVEEVAAAVEEAVEEAAEAVEVAAYAVVVVLGETREVVEEAELHLNLN